MPPGGYQYTLTEEELEGGPPPASPEPAAITANGALGYETAPAPAPAPAAEPAPAPAATEPPPPAAPAEAAPAAAPAATPQYAQDHPYSESMPAKGSATPAPSSEEAPPPARPSGGEIASLNQVSQYNKGNVYTANQGSQASGADAAGGDGIKTNPYIVKAQPQADRSGAAMAKPSGLGNEETKTVDDYRAIEGAGSGEDRPGYNAGGGIPGVSSFADIEVGSRFPVGEELTKSQELSGNAAPPPTQPKVNPGERGRQAFQGAGSTNFQGTSQSPQPWQDPNNTTFAGDRAVTREMADTTTNAHNQGGTDGIRGIRQPWPEGADAVADWAYPKESHVNQSRGERLISGAADAWTGAKRSLSEGGENLRDWWDNPGDQGGTNSQRQQMLRDQAVSRGATDRVGNARGIDPWNNIGWGMYQAADGLINRLAPPDDPHSAPEHVWSGIARGAGWVNDRVTGGTTAIPGAASEAGGYLDHPERIPGIGRMFNPETRAVLNPSLGRRAGVDRVDGDPSLGRMAGGEESFDTNASLGRRGGVDATPGDPSLGRRSGGEEVFTDASLGRRAGVDATPGDPSLGRRAGGEEIFTDASFGRVGGRPQPGDPSLGRLSGRDENFDTNASLGRRGGAPEPASQRTPDNTATWTDRRPVEADLPPQPKPDGRTVDGIYYPNGPESLPVPNPPFRGEVIGPISPSLASKAKDDWYLAQRESGLRGDDIRGVGERELTYMERKDLLDRMGWNPRQTTGPGELPGSAADQAYINSMSGGTTGKNAPAGSEPLPYLNRSELGEVMRSLKADVAESEREPSWQDRLGGFVKEKAEGAAGKVSEVADALSKPQPGGGLSGRQNQSPAENDVAPRGGTGSDPVYRSADKGRVGMWNLDPVTGKPYPEESPTPPPPKPDGAVVDGKYVEGATLGTRAKLPPPPMSNSRIGGTRGKPERMPPVTLGQEPERTERNALETFGDRVGGFAEDVGDIASGPGTWREKARDVGDRVDEAGADVKNRGGEVVQQGWTWLGEKMGGPPQDRLTRNQHQSPAQSDGPSLAQRQNRSPAQGDPGSGNAPVQQQGTTPATTARPSSEITGRKDDWQDVRWAQNTDENGNVSWIAVSNLNTTPLKDADGNPIPGGGKPELVRDENGKPIIARGPDGKVYSGSTPPDGADATGDVPGTGRRGSVNQPERQGATDGKVKPQGDPVAAGDVPAAAAPAPAASGGGSSSGGGGYTSKSGSSGGGGWSRSSGGSSGGGGGWSRSSGSGKSSGSGGRWPFGGSSGDHVLDARGGKWTFDSKTGMWRSSDGRTSRKRPKGRLVRGKRGMFGMQRPNSGVFNSPIFNRYKDVSGDDLTWGPVSDGMVGGMPVAGVPASVEFGTPPPTHPARAGKAGKKG